MNLLSFILPGNLASTCSTTDLYDLLVSVLPTFIGIAERTHRGLWDRSSLCGRLANPKDLEKEDFYLNFYAKASILHSALEKFDPAEVVRGRPTDEDILQRMMLRILNELEDLFLSSKKYPSEFAILDLRNQGNSEMFPKLSALCRIIPRTDTLDEDYMGRVSFIIRIDKKHSQKRGGLISKLHGAFNQLYEIVKSTKSTSSCPQRFSDYPSKNVWNLTERLFQTIREHWSCTCRPHTPPHGRRSVRLNLTRHQRFETAPIRGRVVDRGEAHFRVLFPVTSPVLRWQDAEISVKNHYRTNDDVGRVNRDLCMVLQGVFAETYPRFLIFGQSLWQLRAAMATGEPVPSQIEDTQFRSLRALLEPNQRNSGRSISHFGLNKNGLILSFVLTTFLLHCFGKPWMQKDFNSDNICFYVRGQSPDITRPYFTASFLASPEASQVDLSQPHRFPDLLSLGVLLLEIVQGASIEIKESIPRSVTALERMEIWKKSYGRNYHQIVPDEVSNAIAACLVPARFEAVGLDKTDVNEYNVRNYIFDEVLYPLGHILDKAHRIRLDMLPDSVAIEQEARLAGSFDHEDEDESVQKQDATEWCNQLDGVHEMFFDYKTSYDAKKKSADNTKKDEAHVKIAMLDTGLQLDEALYANLVRAGRISSDQSKDFTTTTEEDAVHGWKKDSDGHGSRIGQIILDVAPGTLLHIAKVFKNNDDLKRLDKVPAIISKAIKCATEEWNVDIIVMCFGFDELIREIQEAIDKALKSTKPPLFFAATRNEAAHKPMAWPASDRSVIGISSTTGNGTFSVFNPSEGSQDSILYAFGEGVPVPMNVGGQSGQNISKRVSGTSYATAVAAGLAATLLGFVRMMVHTASPPASTPASSSAPPRDQTAYRQVPLDLQRMNGMLAVLKCRMQSRNVFQQKSLLPWHFLGPSMLDDNRILRDVEDTLQKRCTCDVCR